MSAMLYSLLVCWWVSYVYTCHLIWILGSCRGCSQKYEHYIYMYIYYIETYCSIVYVNVFYWCDNRFMNFSVHIYHIIFTCVYWGTGQESRPPNLRLSAVVLFRTIPQKKSYLNTQHISGANDCSIDWLFEPFELLVIRLRQEKKRAHKERRSRELR
jgi:hypothetical protein